MAALQQGQSQHGLKRADGDLLDQIPLH